MGEAKDKADVLKHEVNGPHVRRIRLERLRAHPDWMRSAASSLGSDAICGS